MRKRQWFPLLGATVLTGLLLPACAPKNEFVPPPPPEVTVRPPTVATVTNYVGFPGRLEAKEFVEIRARVSGYLRSVGFVDGQRVKEGQDLFVIEPEPYLASLHAAEARLAQTRAATNIANANYQRRVQAYETRAISEIDLLNAKADLDSAEAEVLSAQAGLDQARINLTYTTNQAPQAGMISRRLVSVGNVVSGTEQTLLAQLVVEDPVHVYFYVSEQDILPYLGDIERLGDVEDEKRGREVRLQLADDTIYPVPGRLDYADVQADPETGTLTLRAIFENKSGLLVPGLYGKILIPDVRTNAIVVPDLSIQRDIQGNYLLAVNETNTVVTKYVTRGPRIGDQRVIEEGLERSDRVIVRGLQRARAGITVQPTEATSEDE